SGDNFITLQTLIDRGFSPLDYRYFCLQAHYRKELTFSWEGLTAAKTGRRKLHEKFQALGSETGDVDSAANEKFMSAIEDDLNAPQALALTWETIDSNLPNPIKRATILKFDQFLG